MTKAADLEEQLRDCVRRELGAEVTRVKPLSAGLSLRRFARVELRGGPAPTLVARIEAHEDPGGRPVGILPEPPLEPIRSLLEAEGLPVPLRYGGDAAQGIELLEDVGDAALDSVAPSADPDLRQALYSEACDLVPRLQCVANPGNVAAFGRHLDAAHFAYKAELFADWSVAARGRPATNAERTCVRDAFAQIGRIAAAAPQRLAHRDFQSANLHVHRDAPPGRRLVLIDLQGALLAPPEYDLVCLLRDSYVELAPGEIEAHFERVRPALPDAPDPATAEQRFDLLTLTRKGKDHARFLYAASTRGDDRFGAFVPTTVRHLHAAARRAADRDPRFAALAELVLELPERSCAP